MRIRTKAFGELDIDDRQVIDINEGLIGFQKFKSYALLDAAQKPYFYLQSLELPELAFILVDPFLFRPDYAVDINDDLTSALHITSPDDALILVVVTVPADGGSVTANLMGPLVIGKASRKGAQVPQADPRWQTKHDVMAELAAARS
ncbi:MAG: flagellar assembly protein FliW [Spirochaetales bacterium]|nr:MAG: flagellar assembly protein FliW [Spirochaetales bacterium]